MTHTKSDLSHDHIRSAYAKWAPIYNAVFSLIFYSGRKAASRAANRYSGQLLDVGVGTGLALADYGAQLQVTGVDLSPEMLAKAHEKAAKENLSNVLALHEMDATNLQFADETFDVTVSMFVITITPEPDKMFAELMRVTKHGGEIILLNHYAESKGFIGWLERVAAPHVARFGLRPNFAVERITQKPGIVVEEQRKVHPFGFFTLLRLRKV